MKRRGFLGFLAGGAVAGPSMVKQAAAASITDLGLAGIAGSTFDSALSAPMPMGAQHIEYGSIEYGLHGLKRLMGRTAEQHQYYRNRMDVRALDPDLAVARSFSIGAKIRIQRERDYARSIENERSWLEATVEGWFR